MGNFFKAIKIGYEVIGAILAVQAGGSYTVWPEFRGRRYKVTVENAGI
jgi:hypothetical protein